MKNLKDYLMTDILNKEDILLDRERYLAQSKKIKRHYGHEAYLSALETSLENFEEYMTEFIIKDWAREDFEEGAYTLNKLKRRRDIPPELKSKIEVRARYLEVLFRQAKGLRGYDGIYERYRKIPIRKRTRAQLKEMIREIESLGGHELITKGAKGWAGEWYAERKESRLKKERNRVVSDLMNQIDKAKKDKELEDLAQEVGSLQAQPDYVREYENILEELQAKIEEKYSVVGKGRKFLKRVFNKGRRASQIRTASQMLNHLNKEISDLKKEL